MRIGIIGAGISGIVAAHTLKKCGHDVVVYEKSADIGGVWALGYPGVRLQNTGYHYHISDIPWPFPPDKHPTSGQVREYIDQTVINLQLDIRCRYEVTAIDEQNDGWRLKYKHDAEEKHEQFDFIVVAIGQYTEGKHKPEFPGQSGFKGEVITERDVQSLDVFNDKNVAIVGFGKSAVDMATFASQRAKKVYHVFRTPRWLIPFHIFGIHYARLMFCRMTTTLMPAWAQPTSFERFLHSKMAFLIHANWNLIAMVIRWHCRFYGIGKSEQAKAGLRKVLPDHYIVDDLRSAAAMAPEFYYQNIADEKILPHHSELDCFIETGLKLADGSVIECDQVVLSLGSESPKFPFFAEKYRVILEAEDDGVQLYRHLLHPRIANVAFAGFNHGFMHVPAAEVGMIWLSAYLAGDLQLPSTEIMEESIDRILRWKRKYINFEPSRSCAVNTRYQQYIDIMLNDLGVSPYRKMPNVFAEMFSQYGAEDYKNVLREYQSNREKSDLPIQVQLLDT
jgi:dimethylaniline monooxygenase (N-oxide forming)